jgi:hypothetical protein
LENHDKAANISANQRARAIDLFGIDTIADQWAARLGVTVAV